MNLKKVLFLAAGVVIGIGTISNINADVKVANKTWFPIKFEYDTALAGYHSFIVNPGDTVTSQARVLFFPAVKTRFVVKIPKYPKWATEKMSELLTQAQAARAAGNKEEASRLETEAKNLVLNPGFQSEWETVYDQPVDASKALGAGNRYIEVTAAQTDLASALLEGKLEYNLSNSVYLW